MESAISTMEQMIADVIGTVDPMDDVYLANAIIQANKNARFPGYGMAVTSGLLKARNAEVAKQVRAECAERMRDELERVAEGTNLEYWVESLSDELSAAITQGAFEWECGEMHGFEWRDIPEVREE